MSNPTSAMNLPLSNTKSPLTVVFDLDGTLADTAPDIIGTLNVLLARDGLLPVPIHAARELVGAGARKLLKRGFSYHNQELSDERCESLFHEFIRVYETRLADESFLFAGVETALERLKQAGFILAVCTNKGEKQARDFLSHMNISAYFTAVCGADTFEVNKPHPDHLTRTVKLSGGDIAHAVMVGDSQTDIDTAKAANIPVIAVPFGYTPIPVYDLNPDAIIHHFDELDAALQRIFPA